LIFATDNEFFEKSNYRVDSKRRRSRRYWRGCQSY